MVFRRAAAAPNWRGEAGQGSEAEIFRDQIGVLAPIADAMQAAFVDLRRAAGVEAAAAPEASPTVRVERSSATAFVSVR